MTIISVISCHSETESIELCCRAVLNEDRIQSTRLKEEKRLFPFYPKEGFYTQKLVRVELYKMYWV